MGLYIGAFDGLTTSNQGKHSIPKPEALYKSEAFYGKDNQSFMDFYGIKLTEL